MFKLTVKINDSDIVIFEGVHQVQLDLFKKGNVHFNFIEMFVFLKKISI